MTNISLIIASMQMNIMSLLTNDKIRAALNAYTLTCRDFKMDFMPVATDNSKNVHKAFRLVNMALSEKIFKKWYKHVESNLQCMQTERQNYDKNNSELSAGANININKRL